MTLLGSLQPKILDFPLQGLVSFPFTVLNSDGSVHTLDTDNEYSFSIYGTDLVTPLLTITYGSGVSLISPNNAGIILLTLTTPQKALLSTQAVYNYVLTVLDALGSEVLINSGKLVPVAFPSSFNYTPIPNMPLLSTRFVNSLSLTDLEGGDGYLDGIVTLTQTVGCIIEFLDTNNQPQQWILEAGTTATTAGEYQRGLDYATTTNEKVWRRIM